MFQKFELGKQLLFASLDGDVEKVREMLSNKDLDGIGITNMNTALNAACHKGYLEIVKLFVFDQRADVNKKGINESQTPLQVASSWGYSEIVKVLLNDERVDINKVEGDERNTALHLACEYSEIEVATLLLNDKKIDIKIGNLHDQTPFEIACQEGNIEVIKMFLTNENIEKQITDKDRTMCLLFAIEQQENEVVELLLANRRGVRLEVDEEYFEEVTPIEHARNQNVGKYSWESKEDYQKRKISTKKIIELLESYERNQTETRTKLRIQLGFAGKNKKQKKIFYLTLFPI